MGLLYDKAVDALSRADAFSTDSSSHNHYMSKALVLAVLALVDAQENTAAAQSEATAWAKEQVANMAIQQREFQATILKALEED